MAENQTLRDALRAEILKLVNEGDPKKEAALTPAVLLRIMRVAKTGRDLLVSLNIKDSTLANMVRRPRFGGPLMGDNLGDEDLEDTGAVLAVPYAPTLPSENFGMVAIREMISAAKSLHGGGTSPAKLVEALAIAREKGLEDVAKDLEDQLKTLTAKPSTGKDEGAKPPVAPAPPTPPEALIA